MQDIQKRIYEIEAQAAESALIADLATDYEARIYNGRLARQLRELAADLRKQAQITGNVGPSFAGTVAPSSDGRARYRSRLPCAIDQSHTVLKTS
jgi:hypothetical protein